MQTQNVDQPQGDDRPWTTCPRFFGSRCLHEVIEAIETGAERWPDDPKLVA